MQNANCRMQNEWNRIRQSSRMARLAWDRSGATTVEFALLLAAIALPAYWMFQVALGWLVANYQMVTFLNGWPFP